MSHSGMGGTRTDFWGGVGGRGPDAPAVLAFREGGEWQATTPEKSRRAHHTLQPMALFFCSFP